MKTMKQIAKYFIWVILLYLLTHFLIFVGFNANYKPIELKGETSSQIAIEKAEATKSEGRVYGKVKNSAENNLNGKYIKVSVYDSDGQNITTEYLKIENLKEDEEKSFRVRFSAENAKSYEINIVDNN